MTLNQFKDLPEFLREMFPALTKTDVTYTIFFREIGRKLVIFATLLVLSILGWQWLTKIALIISIVAVKKLFLLLTGQSSSRTLDEPFALPNFRHLRKRTRGSRTTGTKYVDKMRTFLWAVWKEVTVVAPLFSAAIISWQWLTETACVILIIVLALFVGLNRRFFWAYREDIITIGIILAIQRLNWILLGAIVSQIVVSKTRSVFDQPGNLPYTTRILLFCWELGRKSLIVGALVIITTLCWRWQTEIAVLILIIAIATFIIMFNKYLLELGEEIQVAVALLFMCTLAWRWSIPVALLMFIIPTVLPFTMFWLFVGGDIAIKIYNWLLRTTQNTGAKFGEGCAYSGLAMAYLTRGNYKKAIEYFNQHLVIAKEMGNNAMEGTLYGLLGLIFFILGDLETAIDYCNQKVRVIQGLENMTKERMEVYSLLHLIYDSLANDSVVLGDYWKALECHNKQLKFVQEMKDKAAIGRAHGDLGHVYCDLFDFISAIDHYNLQLRFAKEVGDKIEEGESYANLGKAYYQLSEFNKSINYHNLHLAFAKDVGDKAEEGRALGNLGAVYAALYDFKKATDYHTLHLRIAQEEGEKVDEADAYYGLGHCFESLGLLVQSLEHYQSSVTIFNQLTDRLQKMSLRNEYNASFAGIWRVQLKQNKIYEALIAAEEGRSRALTDLMECRYGTETSSLPGLWEQEEAYLERFSPSCTVFLAVDRGTVNIWVWSKGGQVEVRKCDYLCGTRDSYLSLIQVAYLEIGLRAVGQWENRLLNPLSHLLIVQGWGRKSSQPSLAQAGSLTILYNIFIKPIADLVQGSELVIVPDGPLWLAPYAAFKDSDSKYLCESFRIRLIPSLTRLKMIADCPEGYHCTTGALLVGDPWVAEVTDSRGTKLLEQLEFAKQEVEMIGEILNVPPLTGVGATKAEVLRRLASVALVHIAAHCRMENGEIALTPDPERTTAIVTKDDYVLTMADVLSVQLRAKMVVLSRCHSGRGAVNNEGVFGIANAFMDAGARSILISLWAIDDEATLEFMRNFYHHLVEGKSASESLNLAMKSLRESDKYSDVKNWAPFVLIGDDVTLEFGQKK